MRSRNVPRQISVVPASVAMAAPKTRKIPIVIMPRADPDYGLEFLAVPLPD
jgi:hypothetical protein